MKDVMKFSVYTISAATILFLAGCATEKIKFDSVMPARKVADVGMINCLSLDVTAQVTGDQGGKDELSAALVRQLLSERLYRTGFYRVTDDIWGKTADPDNISYVLENASESGHGYDKFITGGDVAEVCPHCGTICPGHKDKPQALEVKAGLKVTLDLALNSHPVERIKEIELEQTPYVDSPSKKELPPTSVPNVAAIVKRVEKVTEKGFVSSAKGTLTAEIVGVDAKDCPVVYKNTFVLGGTGEEQFSYNQPTQLKLLASVITPAIDEIVTDLAPHKESREIAPIKGGDERVVTLLYGRAFEEANDFVTELMRAGKAESADVENQGLALEALGRFSLALKRYKFAAKMNPESKTAPESIVRVEKLLAAAEAVANTTGANKDIQFNK